MCYETQKLGIIQDIFKQGDLKRVIIFSGKKQKVKAINRALLRMHVNSGEMHSDLNQAERDQMLYKFKSGQIDVLVATDIVARGIDIDDIAMVINFDVPHDAEDYVHRIGRTARADRDGVAITFINEEDVHSFKQIEKLLEKEVEKKPLPEELGEGPEYKEGRGQRTSAKSRRRKNRDETAHKRKPRRNENERKPKEVKPKAEVADNVAVEAAPTTTVDNGAAATEQPDGEGRRSRSRRRRGNNKRQQGDADNAQTVPVASEESTRGKQPKQEGKQPKQVGKQPKQDGKQSKQDGKQPKQDGKQSKQDGKQPKQSDKQAKQGDRKAKQDGDRQAKGANGSADNRQAKPKKRSRKPRQQRQDSDAQPVSTKYSKTAGMSPVVNPSKDGALKSLLKKPLKWIKSFGK